MQPIPLPREEFAICCVRDWRLYRIYDGRFIAHRKAKETVRKGVVTTWEAKFIEWPSCADDIPEATRKAFNEAEAEWLKGVM